jgi:4-hydroxythreonine-4-phosphate dehydrogenase
MIYVSSGHERSIALEIFLKSFISLTPEEQKTFVLAVSPSVITKNLESMRWEYKLNPTNIEMGCNKLNILPINQIGDSPLSTLSLLAAMESCSPSDILLTMPTSKDQLILDGKKLAGHTEFFRHYFNNNNIGMLFSAKNNHTLLLTDHIPIKSISETVTVELVLAKTKLVLEKYFFLYKVPLKKVIFSGINPHAGEGGILGNEEQIIISAIDKLQRHYPNIQFIGPVSGDTIQLLNNNPSSDELHVYAFHDQGLPIFKTLYGVLGVNISVGLPYLRMSVDHGTAFSLYGKNKAFMLGSLYLLKHALMLQRVN